MTATRAHPEMGVGKADPAMHAGSEAAAGMAGPSARANLWQRFSRSRSGLAGLAFLALLAIVAIAAPWLVPFDPLQQDTSNVLAKPLAGGHLLGTDDLGRDVLSRLLLAARPATVAPLVAVSVALLLGVVPGALAGYLGASTDRWIMRLVDALQSFPPILLAMGLLTVIGTGLVNAMLAIGIVFTPGVVRIVRASVASVRRQLYIDAAIAIGVSTPTLLWRHVLPNAVGPLLVQASLLTGFALLAEATLSFIGVGTQPPAPSWGVMLANGFGQLHRQPWTWIWPATAIALTVLACNMVGDALRDAIGREERKA